MDRRSQRDRGQHTAEGDSERDRERDRERDGCEASGRRGRFAVATHSVLRDHQTTTTTTTTITTTTSTTITTLGRRFFGRGHGEQGGKRRRMVDPTHYEKNTPFVVLSVAQKKRAPTANEHNTTLHHHNTKKHILWTSIFFPHFQNDFAVQETALTTIPTTTATHTGARGSTTRASTSFLVHWSIDERTGFSTGTPTTPT